MKEMMKTWSSNRREMTPDVPLIVTNLLKYKYLHMEANYQSNKNIH